MDLASQVQSTAAEPPGMAPPVPIFRLSVEQYQQMGKSGILTPEDRVELLEGCLVPKMNKGPTHSGVCLLVRDALAAALPAGWHVRLEQPVVLQASVPEPDVAVARGSVRDYLEARRHPGPKDVALIVEVAVATLLQDRMLKKRVCARDGIPVYWLLNLVAPRVEVYTDPTGPAEEPTYRHEEAFGPGDDVPLALEGKEVGRLPVRELLP